MISPSLLARVGCPLCLETGGCAACGRAAGGHASCVAEYRARVDCACGGPDKVELQDGGDALRCPCCGESYPVRRCEGYVDLVPRHDLGSITRYADHEFHERLEVTDGPPLLSARVKVDMMRRMLRPGPGEAVIDLGCGAGKMALFVASQGAAAAGLDVAPFFLPRAAAEVDLVLGDLRRLPFRKGAFPRAYSLDVLEHLDEPAVHEVLVETRRILAPGGAFFVYTHAMESGALGPLQRGVKRLARALGRAGLIDYEREAMRKSDHRNAIRSHEHFDALCAAAGLEVASRRYYNVFFKAVVEDLAFKIYQRASARSRSLPESPSAPGPEDHAARPVGAPAPGPLQLALGRLLTWLLKLDVVLFGGLRTGPFFALLQPAAPPPPPERGPRGVA